MGTYYGMVRYAASMLVVTTRAGSGTGGVLRVRSLGALVDEQQPQQQQQQQQQVGGVRIPVRMPRTKGVWLMGMRGMAGLDAGVRQLHT